MGHCWRSRDELISDVLRWAPAYRRASELDDQLELIYNSSVETQDVAGKTYRKQWTIEMNGEGGSRKSVLSARHDDNNDR